MVSQTWSLTLDDCRLSLLAFRDHQVPLTLPAILSTLCPLFFWALPALLRWPPDPCPLLGSYMSSLCCSYRNICLLHRRQPKCHSLGKSLSRWGQVSLLSSLKRPELLSEPYYHWRYLSVAFLLCLAVHCLGLVEGCPFNF